jgi:hypothetical protein
MELQGLIGGESLLDYIGSSQPDKLVADIDLDEPVHLRAHIVSSGYLVCVIRQDFAGVREPCVDRAACATIVAYSGFGSCLPAMRDRHKAWQTLNSRPGFEK